MGGYLEDQFLLERPSVRCHVSKREDIPVSLDSFSIQRGCFDSPDLAAVRHISPTPGKWWSVSRLQERAATDLERPRTGFTHFCPRDTNGPTCNPSLTCGMELAQQPLSPKQVNTKSACNRKNALIPISKPASHMDKRHLAFDPKGIEQSKQQTGHMGPRLGIGQAPFSNVHAARLSLNSPHCCDLADQWYLGYPQIPGEKLNLFWVEWRLETRTKH